MGLTLITLWRTEKYKYREIVIWETNNWIGIKNITGTERSECPIEYSTHKTFKPGVGWLYT